MTADAVVSVLRALAEASIPVCIDGGWGVDALLGEQTREHRDLDLILSLGDARGLQRTLEGVGFARQEGGDTSNFVMTATDGREVDVHPIEMDEHGNGAFALPEGRRWPFPRAAFEGEGSIGGQPVRCLSADAQVQCHGQGYDPGEKDLADMERLQERFGVVLPLHLCRQPDRR